MSTTVVEKTAPPAPVSALPFTIAYLPSAFVVISILLGPSYYWLSPLIIFGGIPIVDFFIGTDEWNPSKTEEKELESRISFRLVTYLWVPIQVLTTIYCCYAYSTEENLTISQVIGLSLGAGLNGVAGINFAHELIHKNLWYEQEMGKFCLAMVFNGQFFISHLYIHHKKVSTPDDAASARLGQDLYSFLVRSLYHNLVDAWKYEKNFLGKKGISEWSPKNRIIQATFQSICMAGAAGFFFGSRGLTMFLIQAAVGSILLEVVNYIEHYGLERRVNENGVYSKVNPLHSWNSSQRVTNYFLLKLQRHSHHHSSGNAKLRYQSLRTWKIAPQLPSGYATMILVAVVPPLWFYIMNDRVRKVMKIHDELLDSGIDPFIDPSLELQHVYKVAKAQ